MGPTKRARPSFSPPRPGKSKSNKSTTSTLKKQKAATTARKILNESHKPKAGRQELSDDEDDEQSDDDEEEEIPPRSKGKPKKKSNARSFIMDEASSDEDPDEEDDDDDPETSTFISRPANSDSASPEPDMILAEIEVAQPSQSPIPEALVHKMLSHHFTKGEGVKMSRDARDLVTKYIEVFVREAIMRSAYERQEKEEDGGGGGGGFLEVEDLERAAVQLCLDF